MRFLTMLILCAMLPSHAGAFPGMSLAALTPSPAQEPEPEGAMNQSGLPDGVSLKSGTEVKLVFAQSLSSKHAAIGERVELRVAEAVRVGETIVVPAGARVIGTVVRGKKNEKYGNSKDLAVSVDYVVVKDRRIKLTGEQLQKAKTNAVPATAATIGLGLSGLMIYMSQREAWIREGTPVLGYVAEDVVFTPPESGFETKAE